MIQQTLLVILNIAIVISQRGGGSISSGISSRSTYSSSNSRFTSYRSYSSRSGGVQSPWIVGGLLGGVGVTISGIIGYMCCCSQNYQDKHESQAVRLLKIENLMNSYEQKIANQQFWDDRKKNIQLNLIQNNKWKMQFKDKKSNQTSLVCVLNILRISVKSQFCYSIVGSGNDPIGACNFTGILTFGHSVELFLEKTYIDRNSAGQTGSFNILIYQGQKEGDSFYGKWYYHGYEQSQQYSGNWKMNIIYQ